MTGIVSIISGRPGALRFALRAREEQSLVVPARIQRGARGTRVALPTFGAKYAIRLSNDGAGVLPAPIADLDVGDRITIASSIWWRDVVHPDNAWTYMPSRPVARDERNRPFASVFSEDRIFRVDDNGILGGLVVNAQEMRAAGRAVEPLNVSWRPEFRCRITGISRSGSSTGRDQGWSVEMEEEVAP